MPRRMRTLLALSLSLFSARALAQPVNTWPGDPLTEPPPRQPPPSEPPSSEPVPSEPPSSEAPLRREPPPPKLPPPTPETVVLMRKIAPVKHITEVARHARQRVGVRIDADGVRVVGPLVR